MRHIRAREAPVDITAELSSPAVTHLHRPGEKELGFLIFLIVATAILFAWLLVAVSRATLGDLHLPRLHPSPAQPSPVEPRAESTPAVTASEPVAPEPRPDDGLDAERAVREHLYGRRGRRT